jgi:hypothetical protein
MDTQETLPAVPETSGAAITGLSPADFAVIEQLALGRDLTTLQNEGLAPDGWLLRVMKDPELARFYAAAREMSAYSLEEEAIARLRRAAEAPKKLVQGELRAIEALVGQLRWSAAKRNPNVFSEKAAVHVTVPIQINTSLDMGEAQSQGTAQFPNIYEVGTARPTILDAEVVQEVPRDRISPASAEAAVEGKPLIAGYDGPIPLEDATGPHAKRVRQSRDGAKVAKRKSRAVSRKSAPAVAPEQEQLGLGKEQAVGMGALGGEEGGEGA